MRYLPLLSLVAVLVCGCTAPKTVVDGPPQTVPGQQNLPPNQIETNSGLSHGNGEQEIPGTQAYTLGEVVSKGAVTVYPVMMAAKSSPGSPGQEVATLTEALANGWLTVTEMDSGGTVDTLIVTNTGPKPVLLLAGELVQGGKQDRIIVKDTLIPAGQTVKVSVNCVEHGRWTSGRETFKPLSYQAPSSVRAKAMYENQSAVWDKVSEYNEAAGYSGAETSVNRGLEKAQANGDFLQDAKLLSDLALKDDRAVGAVILINGNLASFELFGNHSLAKGSLPGILAGAFADRNVPAAANAWGDKEVAGFVSNILTGRRLNQGAENGATHAMLQAERAEGKEIGGAGYKAAASPAEGVSGVLHGSYRSVK